MGSCGIEIRGRSRRLRVNYRTTAEVRSWAVSALAGERFDDLDGGEDTLDGYRSLRLGADPRLHHEKSKAGEHRRVVGVVQEWLHAGPAEEICVATPIKPKTVLKVLHGAGIDAVLLEGDTADLGDGVRVATFARMKGLEFPRVLLTGVREGLVPLRLKSFYTLDEDAKALWDRRQRCLLYVAATRARDELAVTGHGAPSPFLAGLVDVPEEAAPPPSVESKACPRCGESGPIQQKFGYRRIRRTRKDGTVVMTKTPQSYCTSCRGGTATAR
jgi:superfamily I DNA/RNA helicase